MKIKLKYSYLLSCLFFLAAVSCNKLLPGLPSDDEVLAGPIPGLSGSQLTTHVRGDEEFARIFSTGTGLGPIFVSNSCESCHIGDGKGHPLTTLTRFGRWEAGVYDPLFELGGPQLQHRAVQGYPAEEIPEGAISADLIAPNVTGMGFLEAVADSTLIALADVDDLDGNGISGNLSWVTPPDYFLPQPHHVSQAGKYIGRFGRKAGAIDLTMQTVGAYKQDMGITSDYDTEDLVNVQVADAGFDDVADPEIGGSTVDNVTFYLRTLKVPPRRDEESTEVLSGEALFTSIGCESCHVSSLTTGDSEISVLDHKEFHPYTDLLLHDMGPDLDDNYTEGSAEPAEWRTTPLWGLGLQQDSQGGRIFLLHDGRAHSIEEAIQYHGGEAAGSREAYNALSDTQKEQLETFLNSL